MQEGIDFSSVTGDNSSVISSRCVEAPTKYYLCDWLDLHGLTVRQCESVLSRADESGSDLDPGVCSLPCDISGDLAWNLAGDAMLSGFPQAAGPIRDVRDKAVRTFRADGAARSFTVPAGPDRHPIVVVGYRGRIVDLLTVAHEFGHAVQVCASNRFVPPVNRELCAFVSELTLLRLLRAEWPALHGLALAAWRAGNRSYLGRHGKALALSLRDRRSVYRYWWNYPIARVLASDCVEHLPTSAQWPIFENRIPLSRIVGFLECAHRNSRVCNGACLTIAPVTN